MLGCAIWYALFPVLVAERVECCHFSAPTAADRQLSVVH